ncbi:MAG: SulP family inorganic anion transporter [Patescibacteria group bacterium]
MASFSTNLKNNWKSGLTVSLVAMPLSISLAVASGSTPLVGIITAVWAGLIASIFGGSNFNVVGPTGALSGLIAAFVVAHGTSSLPVLTILAGGMILVAYALRLERYLIFIPSSVIHGFTLGVALEIGFQEFNSAFGLYGLPAHTSFFANLMESFRHVAQASAPAVAVFAVFLALLFILRRIFPKIPGALLLSPVGILLGYLTTVGAIPALKLATLGSVFGSISFRLFQAPQLQFSPTLIVTAAAVALVAILETMLSAKISDGMTHTKHNERKEMLGLGLANIASGLVGGIPATAALARTSLNIRTGATSKVSAGLSAVFLALISFFFLVYFRYIPMAVIASILVFVAISMVEKEHFIRFYHFQRSGFWISLAVAAVTFYKDPISGIVFGTALSLILFIEKLSRGQFDLKLNTLEGGIVKSASGDQLAEMDVRADILLYSIKGKLAYINSRAHVSRFEGGLAKYKIVILRLRSMYFIDLDGAEALDEIISLVQKRGQQICLTSLNSNAAAFLEQVSPGYRQLKERGLVFAKSEEALRHFGANTDTPMLTGKPHYAKT